MGPPNTRISGEAPFGPGLVRCMRLGGSPHQIPVDSLVLPLLGRRLEEYGLLYRQSPASSDGAVDPPALLSLTRTVAFNTSAAGRAESGSMFTIEQSPLSSQTRPQRSAGKKAWGGP